MTTPPRGAMVSSFAMIGSSSKPRKRSPVRSLALEMADFSRIVIAVPTGRFAPGGMTELVGEIPVL
jgi:hypothetical protein